ncbi:MAG: hypothetical protein AN483_20905, partial [Aphanizomenon flos-aquae MDT14a]
NGHFYKPAAWANFAPAVLAVHWVRVPCLPNPSPRTSPARDGFEKFPICKVPYRRALPSKNLCFAAPLLGFRVVDGWFNPAKRGQIIHHESHPPAKLVAQLTRQPPQHANIAKVIDNATVDVATSCHAHGDAPTSLLRFTPKLRLPQRQPPWLERMQDRLMMRCASRACA